MENLARAFMWGLGIVVVVTLWRIWRRWRQVEEKSTLYDLEIQEKAIREHNAALSDSQLVDQANKGLGIKRRSKADH